MPRLLALLTLCFVSTISIAAEPTHDVVPADYFSLAAITEIALSPDGSKVAYCEARWDEADGLRKANLWLVAADGKSPPLRLTGDPANERHPRWSADGKAVYTLANRKRTGEDKPPYDGSTQIWRVALDGTEPLPMTRVDGGVSNFDYAAKADQLVYSIDTTATDEDAFAKLRKEYTNPEYGHGKRAVSKVYRLDPQTWRAEKIVDEKRYIRELAVTRDGKRLAMITAIDDSVIQSEGRSRVDVWETGEPGASATGGKVTTTDQSWRQTAASPWPWLGHLAWNPAGTKVAYCTVFDAYPVEIIVQSAGDEGWRATRLNRPDGVHIHGYGSLLDWQGSTLLTLGEREGAVGLMTATDNTLEAKPFQSGASLSAMDTTPGSDLIAVLENQYGVRPQIRVLFRDQVLADPNPHSTTWKLPTVRHITWKAPDGATVGGPLELPVGWKKGDKPLPLVVAIHGGPTTSSKADLIFDPHNGRLYFSAAGYAVLCPNYRGSTGYGDKFVTDLIGRENDIEVKDILAGIQHLVDEGIADPERIAVMGWSNGGYLTNCLITLKNPPVKIRAASSGAGILDTVAEWGFNDEPAYPMVFKKGLPWETPDIYKKTSPTYGLGNVTTPTLIHVGGNDVRCPPGHSRMLYRALREYVKVPTELVVYPGEPHGLTKMANRKAKMEWDLAWFDKYVKSAK